jgi:DNA-binding MarR family transcriptional regulator
MSAGRSASTLSPVAAEVIKLEAAVSRMTYVLTRTRRHEWMKSESRVPLDRAAIVVLRQLEESGPVRPGDLAAVLRVEAPHVTRQVQLLERAGYATRITDPVDGRAQLIELTSSGRAASGRVREVGRRTMQRALAGWSPLELHTLGTLLGRMVDDFVAHSAANSGEE